jgi:hypothetical protein
MLGTPPAGGSGYGFARSIASLPGLPPPTFCGGRNLAVSPLSAAKRHIQPELCEMPAKLVVKTFEAFSRNVSEVRWAFFQDFTMYIQK